MKRLLALNLTQKGILLLIAPLSLQALIFFWYNGVLKDTEDLTLKENHSKNVIGRTNYVSMLAGIANLSSLAYVLTHDPHYKLLSDSSVKGIEPQLTNLAEVVEGDDVEAEVVLDAQKNAKQFTGLIADLENLPRPETNILNPDLRAKLDHAWQDLYLDRQNLLSRENTRYKVTFDSMPSIKNRQRDVVAIGLTLNVLMAITAFSFFFLHIVRRLSLISQNAARFAKKEQLNPPIKGSDEVAHLDEKFHDMTEALNLAQLRKQEYMSMISHEVRTPLTSVIGSLDLLEAEMCGPLTENGKDVVSRAHRNVGRVLKLIDELLLAEKLESGTFDIKIVHTESAKIISAAFDSVRELANTRKIQLLSQGDDVVLQADEDRLVQVMINLIGNAIKFSSDHGIVKVLVEKKGDQTLFSILDNGRGVPAEFREKIFERFQQVHREDDQALGGTGLGLPICKMIVEAHGGKIGVEANTDQGSRFWFAIPMTPILSVGDRAP